MNIQVYAYTNQNEYMKNMKQCVPKLSFYILPYIFRLFMGVFGNYIEVALSSLQVVTVARNFLLDSIFQTIGPDFDYLIFDTLLLLQWAYSKNAPYKLNWFRTRVQIGQCPIKLSPFSLITQSAHFIYCFLYY